MYCALRDVTEEKKVEEALRCFMLSTSHDLRTPIHGMEIASELLAHRVTNQQDTQDLISIVRATCHLMLVSIDNVMALKMLDEGAADSATTEIFDVRGLFDSVLDVIRVGSCVDVTRRDDEDGAVPARLASLVGPASRVRQILTNAALCAARGISLPGTANEARALGRRVAGVQASLALCDAGNGIAQLKASFSTSGVTLSAEQAAACFDPYTSCGGLALHVSRALARALGGDCTITTASGGRTTIQVSLRLPCDGSCDGSCPASPRGALKPDVPVALPLVELEAVHPRRTESGAVLSTQQLTERMFAHLTEHGDELFSSGLVLPHGAGAIYDYVSPSVKRWLGWSPEEMLGFNAADFTHPLDTTLLGSVLCGLAARSCANDNAPTPIEKPMVRRMRHKDGSWIYIRSTGALVGARWHCVCRSLRGQAEREAAVRALMLSVSKDIRTPAQSGLAAAALLAQHACIAADAESQFLVSAILASCSMLLNMASNAMSMRSVEEGTLEMRPAVFDPAEAVDELLRVCNLGRARHDGGDVRGGNARVAALRTPGGLPLPARVRGDCALFCHALQNLLTNALKYDDGTGVRVSITCGPGVAVPANGVASVAEAYATPSQTSLGGGEEWKPTHTLLVTVTDSGRGLSPEQCGRIFNAYECAPASQGGGHGLGLFIARACAQRAGGDVSVRSAPGQGSAFTLAFPVELTEDEPTPSKRQRLEETAPPMPEPAFTPTTPSPGEVAADDGGPTQRVCLADDNRLNLMLLSKLMRMAGFDHVTVCDDGAEALATLTSGEVYHLAVLDMCMPTPGPSVVRSLRAWELERGMPRLPVYCLTANVLEEHRAECENAGFDGFLTKPLRRENLAELRDRAQAYTAAA